MLKMNRSKRYSPGYEALMEEVRLTWDPHDPFASGCEWRFALTEVLHFDHGEHVPDYSPGAVTEPEAHSYAVEAVRDLLKYHETTTEDLRAVLGVLNRHREWLRILGRDY
jgi:hypothetical protein